MQQSPARSPRQTGRRHNRDTPRQTLSLESPSCPAAIQARPLPPVKTRIAPAVCPRLRFVTCDCSYRSAISLLPAVSPSFFYRALRESQPYLYSFWVRPTPVASSVHRHRGTTTESAPAFVRILVWVLFSWPLLSDQNFPLRPEPPPPDSL